MEEQLLDNNNDSTSLPTAADTEHQSTRVVLRLPTVLSEFRHRMSFHLGITLVISGILSVLFNIANVCIMDQIRFRWVTFVSGNGFWGGAAVSSVTR